MTDIYINVKLIYWYILTVKLQVLFNYYYYYNWTIFVIDRNSDTFINLRYE